MQRRPKGEFRGGKGDSGCGIEKHEQKEIKRQRKTETEREGKNDPAVLRDGKAVMLTPSLKKNQ